MLPGQSPKANGAYALLSCIFVYASHIINQFLAPDTTQTSAKFSLSLFFFFKCIKCLEVTMQGIGTLNKTEKKLNWIEINRHKVMWASSFWPYRGLGGFVLCRLEVTSCLPMVSIGRGWRSWESGRSGCSVCCCCGNLTKNQWSCSLADIQPGERHTPRIHVGFTRSFSRLQWVGPYFLPAVGAWWGLRSVWRSVWERNSNQCLKCRDELPPGWQDSAAWDHYNNLILK